MDNNMLRGETDTNITGINTEKELQKVPISAVSESSDELFMKTQELIQADLERIDGELRKEAILEGVDIDSNKLKESSKEVNNRTFFKLFGLGMGASTTIFALAGCSVTPIVVVEPIEVPEVDKGIETQKVESELEASMESPDSTDEGGTAIPEIVLSPEQIKEQRLNEIAEVVRENDNTFTIEELDAYLQENGTGWKDGIKILMEYYEGSLVPFQYYFIKKYYKDSGVYLSSVPYLNTAERTMREENPYPTPEVTNEGMLGRITEAIYIDLYPRNSNGRDELWEDVADKYTVIIYLSEEMCEDGVLRDIAHLNIGGFFIYDEKNMVKYISPEEAKSYNFSDEELALIKQKYTTLIHIPYKGVIGAGKSKNGLPVDGS